MKDADLLVGNGFSIGFDSNFIQDSIMDYIRTNIDRKLYNKYTQLFHDEEFKHPESLLSNLKMLKRLAPFIIRTRILSNEISYDEKELDKLCTSITSLSFDAIRQIHPKTYSHQQEKMDTCINYLNKFSGIYTINYDFIPYWLILQLNKRHGNKFNDGFCISSQESIGLLKYLSSITCNIHYLHGAMHLIVNEKGETFKITNNNQSGLINSSKELKEKYGNKYQSLMVFEGKTEEKKDKINANDYLYNMLSNLKTSKNNIIIYGCSIIDANGQINNDEHIWKILVNSNCKNKIYVGLHCEDKNHFSLQREQIIISFKKLHEDNKSIESKLTFFTTIHDGIWG